MHAVWEEVWVAIEGSVVVDNVDDLVADGAELVDDSVGKGLLLFVGLVFFIALTIQPIRASRVVANTPRSPL